MNSNVDSPIAVLGAGSWGTALAITLARNQNETRLWGSGAYVKEMDTLRYNSRYLPDIAFPPNLQIFTNLDEALSDVADVLIAVPSHAFVSVLRLIVNKLPKHARIVWGTKGLDPETNKMFHEIVLEIFNRRVAMAVLAGPSFAKEVALGLPTAVTLASNDPVFAQDLIRRFHSHRFRVYRQDDMVGVQICGAVKNGLAIATGISDGLGLGANARTALITRGLAEMVRLGTVMGGKAETFMGLSGLGDLVLTCTDDQSRNRRFGLAIGRGMSIEEAENQVSQVVEGKQNALKVYSLAKKFRIEMPIIEKVCQVLQGQSTALEAVDALLSREPKPEGFF